MQITFREYTSADKGLFILYQQKLGEYIKSTDPMKRYIHQPGVAEINANETLSNIQKYNGKLWFALDGDKVIGTVACAIWEQSEKNKLEIGPHVLGEVLDLYLDEEYRGKGIGKMMIEKVEKYLKENGCDSIWLSVFAPNEIAHSVYKKYGFVDREVGMLKRIL